jgi:hypothetical protein
MKAKETWINDTLNSLDGIKRAASDPDLLLHLQAKLIQPEIRALPVRQHYYWSVAAGITLLIALNITGALYYRHADTVASEIPAAVATDYLSYLGPIKL